MDRGTDRYTERFRYRDTSDIQRDLDRDKLIYREI